MNIYSITYKRRILNELEFEVEAESEDEAREIAREEFNDMDWEHIRENDEDWNIDKIEDLGEVESED